MEPPHFSLKSPPRSRSPIKIIEPSVVDEVPRSPPSTAVVGASLSPPPEANRLYAGHTPLSIAQMMATESAPEIAASALETPKASEHGYGSLPPAPHTPDIHEEAAARLPAKLNHLPEHPEHPSAELKLPWLMERLERAKVEVDDEGFLLHRKFSHPSTPPEEREDGDRDEEERPVRAVPKLKIKRSMNFGAPLGMLA